MTDLMSKEEFSLGRVCITPGAMNEIPPIDAAIALLRHADGDWGEVDEEDWGRNDAALKDEARLLSVYTARNAKRFWILTEWDRSVTTIFLPREY